MNEDNLHSWIEPELEARIVALVVGEASDFEREELERLINEKPELALFRKRMETMHGMLGSIAQGEPETGEEEWKLSQERRAVVLDLFEESETIAEQTALEKPLIEPKERRSLMGLLFRIAAVVLIFGVLAGLMFPASTGALRRSRSPEHAAQFAATDKSDPVSLALHDDSRREKSNRGQASDQPAAPAPSSSLNGIRNSLALSSLDVTETDFLKTESVAKPAMRAVGVQVEDESRSLRENRFAMIGHGGRSVGDHNGSVGLGTGGDIAIDVTAGGNIQLNKPADFGFPVVENAKGGSVRFQNVRIGGGTQGTGEITAGRALGLTQQHGGTIAVTGVTELGDALQQPKDNSVPLDFDVDSKTSAITNFTAGTVVESAPVELAMPDVTAHYDTDGYVAKADEGNSSSLFSRHFLGGADALRGFDHRDVGRKDGELNTQTATGGMAFDSGATEGTGQDVRATESLAKADNFATQPAQQSIRKPSPGAPAPVAAPFGETQKDIARSTVAKQSADSEPMDMLASVIPEAVGGGSASGSRLAYGDSDGIQLDDTIADTRLMKRKMSAAEMPQLKAEKNAPGASGEGAPMPQGLGIVTATPDFNRAYDFIRTDEMLNQEPAEKRLNLLHGEKEIEELSRTERQGEVKSIFADLGKKISQFGRTDNKDKRLARGGDAETGSESTTRRNESLKDLQRAKTESLLETELGQKSVEDLSEDIMSREAQETTIALRSGSEAIAAETIDELISEASNESKAKAELGQESGRIHIGATATFGDEESRETGDKTTVDKVTRRYYDSTYNHTRSRMLSSVSANWETPVSIASAASIAPKPDFQKKKAQLRSLQVKPPTSLEEKTAANEPFSTFSLHVSDVSFKLAQAALAKGEWPDAEKIRIEEFVNAFDYGDPKPSQEEKVACALEQAIHPFLQQRNLLRVSMRTAAEGRNASTPLRLTFLLDNSGSMERSDRQETVRRAFVLLTNQLQPIDQVTLISFARQPRLLADKVSGAQANQLVESVANLPSEGGTNLEAALQLAFEKAQEQKVEGAQNRIVLLTDGAANLGDAQPDSLAQRIETMRNAGIAFDAAGIGTEGLNDEILEALTRKGDGRYYLLDQPDDADAGFARQIAGALRPAAGNVKVQLEFNPNRVGNYKLLGFEKHRLKKEDFRDDKVDAAEMAAEEAGVAVYQFEPKADGEGDIGFASVRFRDLASGEMIEKRWPIPYQPDAARPEQSAPSLRIATAASLFAAKLKGGPLGAVVELDEVSKIISELPQHWQQRERVGQLRQMIEQARGMEGR